MVSWAAERNKRAGLHYIAVFENPGCKHGTCSCPRPQNRQNRCSRDALGLDSRGIVESDRAFAVMDAACNSAERAGEWRNWAYLTLQMQLAAERLHASATPLVAVPQSPHEQAEEDPDCDWTAAKAKIRSQIPETAFLNWFAPTRQVER